MEKHTVKKSKKKNSILRSGMGCAIVIAGVCMSAAPAILHLVVSDTTAQPSGIFVPTPEQIKQAQLNIQAMKDFNPVSEHKYEPIIFNPGNTTISTQQLAPSDPGELMQMQLQDIQIQIPQYIVDMQNEGPPPGSPAEMELSRIESQQIKKEETVSKVETQIQEMSDFDKQMADFNKTFENGWGDSVPRDDMVYEPTIEMNKAYDDTDVFDIMSIQNGPNPDLYGGIVTTEKTGEVQQEDIAIYARRMQKERTDEPQQIQIERPRSPDLERAPIRVPTSDPAAPGFTPTPEQTANLNANLNIQIEPSTAVYAPVMFGDTQTPDQREQEFLINSNAGGLFSDRVEPVQFSNESLTFPQHIIDMQNQDPPPVVEPGAPTQPQGTEKDVPIATIKSPAATIKLPAATIKSPAATIKSPAATIKSPAATIKSPVAKKTVRKNIGRVKNMTTEEIIARIKELLESIGVTMPK